MMAIYLSRFKKLISAARFRLVVPINYKFKIINLFTWNMKLEKRAAYAFIRKKKTNLKTGIDYCALHEIK
jgi:hypothetical protein